ncbi:NLRC3 [Symbiodinium sp. CCMP2592]|nr:NLRC3 [Symbiodinium sp. CCMP2592]
MKLLFITLMEVVECLLFPDITGWNNFTLVEEPFLPTVKQLDDMEAPETTARWHVWTLIMLGIAFLVAVAGTLILKCAECKTQRPGGEYCTVKVASRQVSRAEEQDGTTDRSTAAVSFEPRTLKVLLAISLTITFNTSFAALAWSSRTGRLSKDYGADWEVYAGLLACSGLALVLQALIMAWRLPPGEKFGTMAFAQACITGMAPVISDQYDTMKDVMFAVLCMESEHVEIQVMGVLSLEWLVIVHMVCFTFEDTTAELLDSHLSVLLLTPDTGAEDGSRASSSAWSSSIVAFCDMLRDKLLVLLYKQLTPTKRFLLLLENVPQAIFAIIFLRYEGGSVVVTVLSLAIPAMQIGLTLLLYSRVRAKIAPYFGRRLQALVRAGDKLLAQRLWREADFESDKELFQQAVAFMHRKEIGAERYDSVISFWKVLLAMHSRPSEEQWGLSDLGLKEELPLVEAFFAQLAAAGSRKLDVDLSRNQLGDAGAKALATAVSSLKKLQDVSLSLEMCDIGTEGAGALAGAIGVLEDLQNLSVNLKNNKICDAGAKALATAVSSLKKIQDVSLNLEMCDIGEEGLLSLLEALRATSPASTQLDLGESDIGKKGVFALARALRSGEVKGRVTHPVVEFLAELEDEKLTELEEAQMLELFLYGHSRGGAERYPRLFGPLCRALPKLPEPLRELKLDLGGRGDGDAFGAAGARALAAGLRHRKELQTLTLGLRENYIGDQGTEALASALRELTELKTLHLVLFSNNIGPVGAAAVAESLRALRQLKKLSIGLESNAFGDAGATALVESFSELPQLTQLYVNLQSNGLSEEVQQKLRAAFDSLPMVGEKRILL